MKCDSPLAERLSSNNRTGLLMHRAGGKCARIRGKTPGAYSRSMSDDYVTIPPFIAKDFTKVKKTKES